MHKETGFNILLLNKNKLTKSTTRRPRPFSFLLLLLCRRRRRSSDSSSSRRDSNGHSGNFCCLWLVVENRIRNEAVLLEQLQRCFDLIYSALDLPPLLDHNFTRDKNRSTTFGSTMRKIRPGKISGSYVHIC